jgi:hypothetical protein
VETEKTDRDFKVLESWGRLQRRRESLLQQTCAWQNRGIQREDVHLGPKIERLTEVFTVLWRNTGKEDAAFRHKQIS